MNLQFKSLCFNYRIVYSATAVFLRWYLRIKFHSHVFQWEQFSRQKDGSKWSNEIAVLESNQKSRFGSDSRFDDFSGMHVIGQTGPAWPADSCTARRERSDYSFTIREAASLTVVCNVCFYVRVFADSWEVFDIVACIHTCYIVAYHPDTVYPLFVCETDRYKPMKYGRIGVDWTAVYEIKALHSINMASMPTHDTNTCTGALHH